MSFSPDYLGGGFSATFVDVTLTGDLDFGAAAVQSLTLGDDDQLVLGDGSDALFTFDTTDANANMLKLGLPAGTATEVPTLLVGLDSVVTGVDNAFGDGATDPRIAIVSPDGTDFMILTATDSGVGMDSNVAIAIGNTTATGVSIGRAGTTVSIVATCALQGSASTNAGSWTQQGVMTLDGDNAEMFLVRKNSDAGDEFVVDTSGSQILMSNKLAHIGDTNTYIAYTSDNIQFFAGGEEMMNLLEDGTQDKVTINGAAGDIDFLVEDAGGGNIIATDAALSLVSFTPTAQTSGSPTCFTYTDPAHTTLTASTAANSVFFDLSSTKEFDTGAIGAQSAFAISAPTYSFVGSSTISAAFTMIIDGVPEPGTNATISIGGAFVVGDATGFTSDIVGTATAGLIVVPGIGTGIGAVSQRTGLKIGGDTTGSVSLGDQTDTLTNLNSLEIDQVTYNSTTNTRTVTNPAAIYVAGAPVAGTNMTFTNGPYSIWVDAGNSRFDGDVTISGDTTLTAGDIVLEDNEATFYRTDASNVTASTQSSGLIFGNASTRTWDTGAIAIQTEYRFRAPTYAFAAASTITDAATLYVNTSPIAGANATITNSYALWVDLGTTRIDGAILSNNGAQTICDASGNLASANGANFGPGAVTSITVVNGIVTAIS